METVAAKIKRIIDAKGIKYSEIYQNTGIPVDALSKSFMNKRRMNADEMIAICKYAKIDIGDLTNERNQLGH